MKTLLLMLAATLGIAFSGLATDNKCNRINPNDLVNIAFFGTEPFWNLNFTENGINFKTMNGEETSMWYARNGNNFNNQLQGAGEYDPNNNLVMTGIGGNNAAVITISYKECSDGMSDNIYPYSVSINWLDETPPLKGCGRIKDNETILKEKMGKLEGELNELLQSLVNEVENAYFYTNDIKEHALYKETDPVRAFVDKLLKMGYGIEQAEGRYYLYIGEPNNYTDGEPQLEEEMGRLEKELNELLQGLVNEVENANYYPNDIKEHALYKEKDPVRAFVDKLLKMGYGIEQAEGRYYLYIGEPNNYTDGETE